MAAGAEKTPASDETRSSRSALSSCPLALRSERVRTLTGARIRDTGGGLATTWATSIGRGLEHGPSLGMGR